MKFNKGLNRPNEAKAAWLWFQLLVHKSKMLRNDAAHIVVGKDSQARSLGVCTYYFDQNVSKVTISPYTILDCNRVQTADDLFNQVAHTGVHEVCHGITQRQYYSHALRRITVNPHGREWNRHMQEFGIYDGQARGGRGFPMLFAETEFLKDARILFEDWRRGEFDGDLWKLCLQSRV
jgi:hypothetical protein